ncbi:uncharacterized protein LOC130737559 [Lotus japonicus]|uniref:uncharacterized protein LOC130737559 n=1 Tax=Lotus japonicus TaxID=34305 RepID=UPI002582AFBA|nr:uncharacterized protein LOC130737559 [Lotus japonicus]
MFFFFLGRLERIKRARASKKNNYFLRSKKNNYFLRSKKKSATQYTERKRSCPYCRTSTSCSCASSSTPKEELQQFLVSLTQPSGPSAPVTNSTFVHGEPSVSHASVSTANVDVTLQKHCRKILKRMKINSLTITFIVGVLSDGEMKSLLSCDKESRVEYVNYLLKKI